MIVSDLSHISRQVALSPNLQKAFDFLRSPGLQALPDGRVEIDGDRVFALVQRFETKWAATPKFECHQKYIDIQFVLSGEEIIGWASVERMEITVAYDAGKDISFGTVAKGQWTPVHLQAGQMAVLYPEDGHAPKMALRNPSAVMKIVVKVGV
jgi:YhcH/YjgK/YiaL family protein